jgi:transcription termination/antitermination protein NusG
MIVPEPCDTTGILTWFAVQTLSRHEKMVRDQLTRRNVEHFLPTTRRINQWTDRRKEVEVPLFAGYCFVRLSWADRLAVLQSQGVVRFVGSVARPEPIPDEEINSLRTLVKNSSQVVCHPYLKEGMLVEVTNGPLQGIKGRLVREPRRARLVLNVTLIQRAVAVEIDAENVAPVLNDHELCQAR